MSRALVVVMVVLGGCVQPSVVDCGDGRVCPAGTTCDDVNHQCVSGDQLTMCVGIADGTDCTVNGAAAGVCRSSVCIEARCGDGERRGAERCDGADLDGKATCRDLGYYNDVPIACASDCTYDVSQCQDYCGDHVINGAEYCEPGMPLGGDCLDFGYDRGLLSCTGACQPDFTTCERFGIASVGTGAGANFTAVWGSGPTDVFVVGGLSVAHWDGMRWTQDPGPGRAYAVWGSGPNDLWTVGDDGVISHDHNGVWTSTTETTAQLDSVWGSGPSDIYAAGNDSSNSVVLHYNGTTWSPISIGTTQDVSGVWGSGPNDVYVLTYDEIRNNSGSGWSQVGTYPPDLLMAIDGTGANDVWIVSQDNAGTATVRRKTTGAFTAIGTFTMTSPYSVAALGSDRAAFGLQDGLGFVDGTKLLRMPGPPLTKIWASGPSDIWGITQGGGVRHFAGTGWLATGGPTTYFECMSGLSDTSMYMLGTTLAYWDGETWTDNPGPPTQSRTLWAAAANDAWVGSTNGAVYRWNGSTWSAPMTTNTTNGLLGMFGLSTSDVWAVGPNGTIIHYNGAAWSQPMTSNTTGVLSGVWAASATNVYAVGAEYSGSATAGIILHFNGTSWSKEPLPAGDHVIVFDVWGTGPNNIYAAGFGEVLHFDGTAWTSTPLAGLHSLYTVGGSGPNDVYVAGQAGLLYRFDGTRWLPMRSGTDLELRSVYVSAHRLAIARDGGALMLMKP